MANSSEKRFLKVQGARHNNLKNINTEIPLNYLVSIIGVSGSGKSSLIYDIIANESVKHFNYHLTSSKTHFNQRIDSGDFDRIENLPAGISIRQNKRSSSIYSTLGTLSDLSDYLRIAFARFSDDGIHRSKSQFSYHSPSGHCSNCKGLGTEEFISKGLLLNDHSLSISEGLIKTILPTGYIMYSQLRMEELEKVCQAHGFSTKTPWNQLTEEQKDIIWHGSKEVTVTFGKHTLESRLKWKNLKAKPPEEGFYKGMMPIMEDILRRDRNPSILKYVDSRVCSACEGTGLQKDAKNARLSGYSIGEFENLKIREFENLLDSKSIKGLEKLLPRLKQLILLGFGDYSLNTKSSELESGEIQRLRLSKALNSKLSGVLYVFDEPFIGIHPELKSFLLNQFKELVNKGNSVFLIDHDLEILEHSDYILELGPNAGTQGGEIVFEGEYNQFIKGKERTISQTEYKNLSKSSLFKKKKGDIELAGLNLKEGAFNIITGSISLKKKEIIKKLKENTDEIVFVNDSPIGKTSRSTPSTYTGIADDLRNLFAALPESKELGLEKKHYSFNTKDGACSTCQGTGKIVLGFSYMGQIEKVCPTCEGKRYKSKSLQTEINSLNIFKTQEKPINQLIKNNHLNKNINTKLNILANLGLGYLSLNQSSNSLSGGEAQRIKLAKHLIKKELKNKWLLLENPSNGLHYSNLKEVIDSLEKFLPETKGIICVDHHLLLLEKTEVIQNIENDSISNEIHIDKTKTLQNNSTNSKTIELKGVKTKNIDNQDFSFEKGKIYGFTGPTGSGKSALLKDTLYQIARNESIQHLSAYDKSFIDISNDFSVDNFKGIGPTLFISNESQDTVSNSTISTYLDINKKLRFLYSRLSELQGEKLSASHFSKNHPKGQCKTCKGKINRLITNLSKVINKRFNMSQINDSHNSFLSYYTNPDGQFTAVFKHICETKGWDHELAFKDYSKEQMDCYLNGTGDTVWELDWEFKTKSKSGIEKLKLPWKGICNYIEDDYEYSKNNKTVYKITEYLKEVECEACHGTGLNEIARTLTISGLSINELEALSITDLVSWLNSEDKDFQELVDPIKSFISPILDGLINLDLGYLSLDRLSHTLSGGEMQRLRIADKIASPLTGLTYIIEEISSLLPKDKRNEIGDLLIDLKNKGNTIFIIDKDEDLLGVCDEVIKTGDPSTALRKPSSQEPVLPERSRRISSSNISFSSFEKHGVNLKQTSIDLGGLTAITGPSGIGKTTLLRNLYYILESRTTDFSGFKHFHLTNGVRPQIEDVPQLNQLNYENHIYFKTSKPSQKKLSDYFNLEKEIIKIFAKQLNIKAKDLQKNKQNVCPDCKGNGFKEYALDIEANLTEECLTCHETGYKAKVLQHQLDESNIYEWLCLSFSELFTKLSSVGVKIPKRILELKKWILHFNLRHLTIDLNFKQLASGERFKFSWIKTLLESEIGVRPQFGDLPQLEPNALIFMDEPSKNLYYSDIDEFIESSKNINADILMIEHCEYLVDRCNFEIKLV